MDTFTVRYQIQPLCSHNSEFVAPGWFEAFIGPSPCTRPHMHLLNQGPQIQGIGVKSHDVLTYLCASADDRVFLLVVTMEDERRTSHDVIFDFVVDEAEET